MKAGLLILLITPVISSAMIRTESDEVAKNIVKDLVRQAIEKKERSLEHSGVVTANAAFVKLEVDAGAIYIDDQKGILCADNKIFVVDYRGSIIEKIIQMPARLENPHNASPAICALASMKNMLGAPREKIILGEEQGRILLVDGYEFKTFGQVNGRILSFACHPAGTHIAVRFTAKDSSELPVPCFALSVAYLKKQAEHIAHKRRSWNPVGNWEWTDPITKQCEHEVKNITFDGEHCITECATGFYEKWCIVNPERNPELILVSRTEKHP